MSVMSASFVRSPTVFVAVRDHLREFVARHTYTPDERARRLAGYAPTAVLGTASR